MKKQKILVVDDSEMNRAILIGLIEGDYDFVEAGNGAEALKILRETDDIDLMLLDIIMPVTDGIGLLELMKENGLIHAVPVIIVSAENSAFVMHQAYKLGAIDYISRPFDTLVVQRRVRNTLMLYAKQEALIAGVRQVVDDQAHYRTAILRATGLMAERFVPAATRRARIVRRLTPTLLRVWKAEDASIEVLEREAELTSTAGALAELACRDAVEGRKAEAALFLTALATIAPPDGSELLLAKLEAAVKTLAGVDAPQDATLQALKLADAYAIASETLPQRAAQQAAAESSGCSKTLRAVFSKMTSELSSAEVEAPVSATDGDADEARWCAEEFLSTLFAGSPAQQGASLVSATDEEKRK